ncbi:hypothetical protein AX17_002734 [Amanita inopinata Kibby_2008]|nr:hypothetical protein AX17_002734 [Amanita inopinata Kibby_2008]
MLVNAVAENVLGTIGTICWTAQLVPQIWKSWREGSTKGLSHWLVLIWGITGAFLGTYAIVQNLNIPLILQPQLFALLSLISWGQCQYYEKGRSKLTASLLALAVMVLTGAFEVAMVFAVRPSYKQGNNRGVMFFGILTSVLIALALLPQYWEIYRHRERLVARFQGKVRRRCRGSIHSGHRHGRNCPPRRAYTQSTCCPEAKRRSSSICGKSGGKR